MEENNWNEFEETNKNNLLILNLLFIFLNFFLSFHFSSLFSFFHIFLQIFWEPNMTFIK